jgi:mRNA-degrading endonuclease RelE of RelBE toxin-antitoxin system/predicted nucleic acid-binding Zn ribbon protein
MAKKKNLLLDQAVEVISSLSGKIRERIQKRIEVLVDDPFNPHISLSIHPRISITRKPDTEARYSLVGDYRIIYRVNEEAETLEIVEIEKKEKLLDLKKRLSKVNELRRLFWTEFRALHNDFLFQYPGRDFKDDPQWQEIMNIFNDMRETTLTEETRRRLFHNPQSIIYDATPHKGLYKANRLCVVCGLPLKGRQRLYCSEICHNIKKSRKWREENPDEKRKSELKYLKDLFPDE